MTRSQYFIHIFVNWGLFWVLSAFPLTVAIVEIDNDNWNVMCLQVSEWFQFDLILLSVSEILVSTNDSVEKPAVDRLL